MSWTLESLSPKQPENLESLIPPSHQVRSGSSYLKKPKYNNINSKMKERRDETANWILWSL